MPSTMHLLGCSLLCALATASLSDNGSVTTLNNIPYYVSGVPIATFSAISPDTLRSTFPEQDLLPLTVIAVNNSVSFSVQEYNTTLSRFRNEDDVFQDGFLQAVYISDSLSAASLDDCSSFSREAYGTKILTTPNAANVSSLSPAIPSGPYFVSIATGKVFKAYRLYRDDNLAFTQPAISDERDGFLTLPATTADLMTRSIAVPSRLYYTPSASQPLAGLRFAVKDIFHVKGLKTSGGSRAYYETYDAQPTTAISIQRLLDLGAVLVGKTGLAQFANGDQPTADWVDLHCPFNPRGDGYQDPSGSSTGSGVAVAAYAWLDMAIGTDTGGSMRGPAASNGVYGNRPSTGAVSMQGVLPLSPHLDTAGVFTRSAALWSHVTRHWYNATADAYSPPTHIYISHASTAGLPSPAAAALFASFLARLSRAFNTTTTTTVTDVRAKWAATHNATATADDLDSLLNLPYGVLTAVDQYNLLGASFLADHAATNAGALPYINPNPRARWAWGAAALANDSGTYDAALRNMTAFRGFWEATYFPPSSPSASPSPSPSPSSEHLTSPSPSDQTGAGICGSRNLYIYIRASAGTATYRDEYVAPRDTPPLGFDDWTIAGYAGAPEVVLPLGEVGYESRVTGRTEWVPVAVDVMAGRGCDGWLVALVGELVREGVVLGGVGAGKRI